MGRITNESTDRSIFHLVLLISDVLDDFISYLTSSMVFHLIMCLKDRLG